MGSEEASAEEPRSSWREQVVARRLDPARVRAEDRVQRFLDAALELMNNSSAGIEFTVQEVVERSGQSLRSFYQYFGGKQELLLALFEEAVLSTAKRLRAQMLGEPTPSDKLHRIVTEYYRICRRGRAHTDSKKSGQATPPMAQFAQQLLISHPAEAALAFSPLIDLFAEVLQEAAEGGVVRTDVAARKLAGVILETVTFNVFSRSVVDATRSGEDADEGELLLDLMLNGMKKR